MTPNDKLRALMREHNLTRRQVCDLLGLRVWKYNSSNPRVDKWLSGKNKMPPQMLELLEIKLAATPPPSGNKHRR